MLKVIVTGGIGSGKSSVVEQFKQYNVPVIDTDVIAHHLTKDKTILLELKKTFGPEVINKDGTLNRARLRELIFNNQGLRRELEIILHPMIHQKVLEELESLENQSLAYCLIVIPLFAESTQDYPHDRVLVVDASESTQIQRAAVRDNKPEAHIKKIIENQASRQARLDLANDVLNNDGPREKLPELVRQLHEKYISLSKSLHS